MSQYICVNSEGCPLKLAPANDTPKAGVLWIGDIATLFNSYSSAYRAIRRTRQYEKHKKYHWHTWGFRVMRLVPR